MRDNNAVWRCGHRKYKAGKQLWAIKTTEMGLSVDHLVEVHEGLVCEVVEENSRQATKKLTDKEEWILGRITFYTQQLKLNEGKNAPMHVIQRQQAQPQMLCIESTKIG